jgi:hypothetical protein
MDRNGFVQLSTIRSSPAKAWEALFGRKLTKSEREGWKKSGFRVGEVTVESFTK